MEDLFHDRFMAATNESKRRLSVPQIIPREIDLCLFAQINVNRRKSQKTALVEKKVSRAD